MAKLHPMLQPYQPTADDPFDASKAAHLYNRAGFAATPDQIQHALQQGPAATIDQLLDFPDHITDKQQQATPDLSALAPYPADFRHLRKLLAGKDDQQRKQFRRQLQVAQRQTVKTIAHWWLNRMATGPHPLQEKLTLFWHGHFTSHARSSRSAMLIWKQNQLLRRMAAANFGQFVREVSRDPAMLDYLNNQQNRKAQPNENYARELMELFTLGIGNYTETDVKEAARAFTGWRHDGDDFTFREKDHDFGIKQFLGRRGKFDGDDIISIILDQPACAPFIAQKLFRFFVYDDGETELAESLGNLLRDNDYELRPLLKTILSSRAFFSKRAIGSQIKSPIQLVVGTARLLDLHLPNSARLERALRQMGQVPFAPPNVRGWPGGRMWINTSTFLARNNALLWLVAQKKNWPDHPLEPAPQLVDHWLTRLIQRPIAPDKQQILIDALTKQTAGPQALQHLVQLIVTLPEYQLC